MSSGRSATFRGGKRGSGAFAQNTTRDAATPPRGGGSRPAARREIVTVGGSSGQSSSRGSTTAQGLRGGLARQQGTQAGVAKSQNSWQDRYDRLKQARERERQDAIRKGIMADPEKPRALADAITPVGTCQDMCPEFERVQRVVQDDVWDEETDPNHSAFARGDPPPIEYRMVKKFRRSAAGYEEQLPSDLRPPLVLKKTLDYLFDEVIGQAKSLAKVHHFVWDRTRAIRNDLSIQQLTKADDVRIAIDCYERIARFHLVSLHQLALGEKPYDKYDSHQEREQLDRSLLSLMQYYDDSRGTMQLTNEAEFRAYCIVFQLQDPVPDLDSRMQAWPETVRTNAQVQTAFKIYCAACTASDPKGPIKPFTSQAIARQDWESFWQLIGTDEVSYILGCVAEIYFNHVRRVALKAIVRCTRSAKAPAINTDWTLDELWDIFRFDDVDQLVKFCEDFGLSFQQKDGVSYLDLGPLAGKVLSDPGRGAAQGQLKSSLVETKRQGRALPAVIDGLSVDQAIAAGLIEEDDDGIDMAEGDWEAGSQDDGQESQDQEEEEDADSLFLPEKKATIPNPFKGGHGVGGTATKPFAPFGPSNGRPASGATPAASADPASRNPFTSAPNESRLAATPKPTLSFGLPSAQNPAGAVPPLANSTANLGFPNGSPFGNPSAASSAAPKAQPQISFGSASKPSADAGAQKPLFAFGAPSAVTQSLSQSPFQPVSKSTENITAASDASKKSPLFDFKPNVAPAPQDGAAPSLFKPSTTLSSFSTPGSVPLSPQPDTSQRNGDAHSTFNTSPLFANPASTTQPTSFPSAAKLDGPSLQSNFPSTFGQPSESAQLSNFGSEAKAQVSQSADAVQLPPATANTGSGSSPKAPQTQQHTSSMSAVQLPPAPTHKAPNLPQFSRASSNDHRPKSPSPLVNSFTAGEHAPSFTAAQNSQSKSRDLFTTENSSHQSRPLPASKPQIPAGPSLDDVLTRLAKELTHCPGTGILDQYVDFIVGKVVTEIQQKVYIERLNEEADEYRRFSLEIKYGKLWRELCYRRRLTKKARASRQRAQRRLHQVEDSDGASMAGSASLRRSSNAGSSAETTKARRQTIDTLFQSTVNRQSIYERMKPDNKRQPSSGVDDVAATAREPLHRRMKSTSHAESRRSSEDDNAEFLRRSAFMAFSSKDAPRVLATKSPYFRMKAMGLNPDGTSRLVTGTKRSHSSLDDHLDSSLSQSSSAQLEPSAKRARDTGLMLPPEAKTALPASIAEQDDQFLTRLRDARVRLGESNDSIKTEAAKEEDYRKSFSSQSSGGSTSLMRIRASLRASHTGSHQTASTSGREIPAYRLRESRFVPREKYVHSIEQAKEMRSSRSGNTSRSASRLGQHPEDNLPQDEFDMETTKLADINNKSSGTMPPSIDKPNDILHPNNHADVSSSLFGTATSFKPDFQTSAFSQAHAAFGRTGFGFEQANAQASTSAEASPSIPRGLGQPQISAAGSMNPLFTSTPLTNPFSYTPSAQHTSNFFLGPTPPADLDPSTASLNAHGIQDQTIQPSQIDDVLSHSFGQPPSPEQSQAFSTQQNGSIAQGFPSFYTSAASQSLSNGDPNQAAGPYFTTTQSNNLYGGHHDEANPSEHEDESDDGEDNYAGHHVDNNPYAALAHGDDPEGDESGEDDENEMDDVQSHGEDDGFLRGEVSTNGDGFLRGEVSTNGDEAYSEDGTHDSQHLLGSAYGEEEALEDGDVEDYDESEEEGDDDDDDEDDDSDATHQSFVPQNYAFNRQQEAGKNPALQEVGGSVEEAIELSD